jgi:4-amino-4-deoxy-L-arabinose transferase-like glycosyltransferase
LEFSLFAVLWKTPGRRAGLALSLLALWLLLTIAWRPLALPDEGRYASVTAEMWRGNGWLPTLNGLPFFHKPPLSYWVNMVFMGLFGHHPWTARMAPALGAWLMGAALFLAQRRWVGERAAWMALGLLATTPFFFMGGQYGNLDMLVAGCISVTVLALVRALDVAPTKSAHLGWLCAGWVACALAVLAKGLIGFLLPGLIVLPWLWWQGRWRHSWWLFHPLGLICFFAVVSPWFYSMQMAFPEFADYFFMEQHFRRFAGTTFNNVRPVWFFAVVLLISTLPWSVWGLARIRRIVPKIFFSQAQQNSPSLGFYAWWFCVVVVFFSLPSSKLVGYVLPALLPTCVLLQLGFNFDKSASETDLTRGLIVWGFQKGWYYLLFGGAFICLFTVSFLTMRPTPNHASAAQVLVAQAGSHDRVVMVDEYFYDIPFLARLSQPVQVVSDWDSPEIAKHDNWRKELLDAARFTPDRGRSVLWTWARWDQTVCAQTHAAGLPASSKRGSQGAPQVWYVIKSGHAPLKPLPSSARKQYGDSGVELWRAPLGPC